MKSNSTVCLPGERLRAFPLDALEVDQVPEEHRLALEQIEAVAGKAPARRQDHALGATFGDGDVRRDGVGGIQQEGRITLRESHHRPGVDELRAAGSDVRARGDDPRRHRGIQREDLVFLCFRDELLAQFRHLLRMLGGDVVGLAEVPGQVVELEHLVVQGVGVRHTEGLPGRTVDLCAEQPAVVVQRPLAHHLEVLGLVVRRRLGVGGVEGVEEAGALDRRLLDAVDLLGRGDAGGLEDGGHDVDHVDELLAQSALVLDARRPGHHHVLVDAAEPGSVLLEPVERRVEGPGPSGRHVVVGFLGAPNVVELHLHVDGQLTEAIEERDLVGRAKRPALGAGAVVAVDVDDQGVVEPAEVLEGLDHTADLVVVVGSIGGEDLHLADEELLRLRAELIPGLQEIIGPGRQLRILGDHAEALLVLEDALAQLVVAVVEEVHRGDLVHPLLGRVMWRVRGAGRVLDEDRLAGVGLVDARDVVDRVVRHAGDEVPARLAVEGIDLGGVAEQIRLPLVGVAADKAVEILEAQAGRPLVEGPDLAGGKRRGVVVLAEPRRGIAVVEQDPPDGGLVLGDDAVVAREARRLLGDHPEAGRVMVSAGDERRSRRRAQRRGKHAIVAQTLVGDAVHSRRRDHPAESARHAEAGIVGDDEQDVGRAPWAARCAAPTTASISGHRP